MAAEVPDILTRKDTIDTFLNQSQQVDDRLLDRGGFVSFRGENLSFKPIFIQPLAEASVPQARVARRGLEIYKRLNQFGTDSGLQSSITPDRSEERVWVVTS